MIDVSAPDDLISRAELLNDLSYCAPELWQDEEYVKAKIMKQPAVDAVPVVHGRWIEDNYGYFHCSECGFEWDESEVTSKYCPDCGAKMDGGDDGARMD